VTIEAVRFENGKDVLLEINSAERYHREEEKTEKCDGKVRKAIHRNKNGGKTSARRPTRWRENGTVRRSLNRANPILNPVESQYPDESFEIRLKFQI